MANTRNRNTVENSNAEKNNATNPSLPPAPTLEQVPVMQAQMLQTMVNMQNVQHQVPPLPPRDILGDFQCTKPSTISHSSEPMHADDCLKSVEKKMQVV
jgi:hypothetical protein